MSVLDSLLATAALAWIVWKGFERMVPAPARRVLLWVGAAVCVGSAVRCALRCTVTAPRPGLWIGVAAYLGLGAIVYTVRTLVLGREARVLQAKARAQALTHVRHRAPPAAPGRPQGAAMPTTLRATRTP